MNFADFRHLAERAGEVVVVTVGRRIQADEGRQKETETLGIELRRIALDVSALLQTLDPVVNRRRLEADDRSQLGKGRACVALQRIQELEVEFVEFFGRRYHIRQGELFAEQSSAVKL